MALQTSVECTLGTAHEVSKKLAKRRARAKARATAKGRKNVGANVEDSDGSSSELPMTDEHRAFIAVFGSGKKNRGDPITANKVLCDYATQFPKGAKANTKQRMTSNFFLTSYTHPKGTRHAKKSRSVKQKMNSEAFVCAMENKRKWKAQRADEVWRELDIPENYADNYGPHLTLSAFRSRRTSCAKIGRTRRWRTSR